MKSFGAALALLCLPLAGLAVEIDGPLDTHGRPFLLSNWSEDRLVVVAFLGAKCPLGSLYALRLNELHDAYAARGVAFVAVDANQHDTPEEIAEFGGKLSFTMIADAGNRVADVLGATRSPEVFLLDERREVVYRGRIDDQYAPGVHGRSEPTRRDLEIAIGQALDHRTIAVPITEAVGCHIDRAVEPSPAGAVTYTRDVAPIFDAHCVACHRPGQAAPFSLISYDDALAWRGTIRDMVEQKRMPPWGAHGGDFVNDLSLSQAERATIFAWLDAGAPEGDPAARPPLPKFAEGWSIRADRVLSMAAPFEVPAEGVLDYQDFAIDPGFAEDTWVQSIEVRPGNRSVVHHINVYTKPKHAKPDDLFVNDLGDYYLAMAVPGNSITVLPTGTAKVIPAGWDIVLSVHYVTNGTAQLDTSCVALTLADRSTVYKQMATRAIMDNHLVIEPFEKKVIEHQWTLEEDYTLYALYPHMHLRGRSMSFVARYPSGESETLLDVDPYDFNWQFRYVLRQPKPLPRGTVITARAVYDNTAENPNNPAPDKQVCAGRQTTDEMFQACFEICRTHEDLIAHARGQKLAVAWVMVGLATAACVWRRVGRRAGPAT